MYFQEAQVGGPVQHVTIYLVYRLKITMHSAMVSGTQRREDSKMETR
jgi:hypothetical protein